MNDPSLGVLRSIELRTMWPDEAADFSLRMRSFKSCAQGPTLWVSNSWLACWSPAFRRLFLAARRSIAG
jgi:hypothetical protein